MRLCSRMGIKRLIVLLLLCQFVYVQNVQAVYPLVIQGGRVILTRVLGNVVTKRAIASVAANEALIGARVMQTYRALGTVAANDARFALGATSTLRHAKDISWVSLALGSGVISLSDLNVEGNDKLNVVFEPSAVKLSDGRYAIQVNGETKIVNANPSQNDPIIYQYSKEKKQISAELNDIYVSDTVDNRYKYYDELRTGEYAQSNSLEKLSEYIAQEDWGGKGEMNYQEIDINGKMQRYLSSETIVENRYLRHQQIGDRIYPTVRQTFTEKRLKYDFEPVLSGFTGESAVHSFNPPQESDYEVSTRVNTITYIDFDINEDWVGDNAQIEPQEQQLGSITDLDLSLYTQSLTSAQVAQLYNALLMSAASQPDYEGVPFSSANPVTASEVAASFAELGVTPTYADLFAKAGTGNKLEFEYNVSPSPNPLPTTRPNEEFDENKDISELAYPELEMPTAHEILEPFTQFFPQLANFQLKAHSAQCPKWQLDIPFLKFNHELKEHCELIENQRSLITLIFSLVWAFIALRHLLSA